MFTVIAGGLAEVTDGNSDASNAAGAGIGILSLALTCVVFLYGLVLTFLLPAITMMYARTRDIASCLRLGEVFGIARKNMGDYLIIFLVLIGANLALSTIAGVLFVTVIGLCLAIPLALVSLPYFNVLAGHLCGQYMRSEPLPVASPPIPPAPLPPQ